MILGIDPGTKTGLAVWNGKDLSMVVTWPIHKVIEWVSANARDIKFVRVEDARKRKWFGANSKEKQQGAGSIKRDSTILDDFLADLGVDYEMIHPIKGATKLNTKQFKQTTGYEGRTSEHSRDAAMMVYKFKPKNIKI